MKSASHSSSIDQPRVLVTGIDSFTGQHLKQHLEQSGFSVFGTSFGASHESNIFTCDITNKKLVLEIVDKIKPDFVIHLAGISFVGHPNIKEFYEVNVVGAQNILDGILLTKLDCKKIILASSATVYGNQGLEVLDESLCPVPANHYGISKLAMEYMARTYYGKLPLVVTRPFNYVGLGQPDHFVIPKIVKHFKEGRKTIELGNINVEREFNDVSFACEVYKRLLLSDAISTEVNLCSGRPISLMSVIETMQEIAGYAINVRVHPEFVRPNELPRLVGSVDRLLSMIGEVKSKSLERTLEEMYIG